MKMLKVVLKQAVCDRGYHVLRLVNCREPRVGTHILPEDVDALLLREDTTVEIKEQGRTYPWPS